jgi:hypothetical protein
MTDKPCISSLQFPQTKQRMYKNVAFFVRDAQNANRNFVKLPFSGLIRIYPRRVTALIIPLPDKSVMDKYRALPQNL